MTVKVKIHGKRAIFSPLKLRPCMTL